MFLLFPEVVYLLQRIPLPKLGFMKGPISFHNLFQPVGMSHVFRKKKMTTTHFCSVRHWEEVPPVTEVVIELLQTCMLKFGSVLENLRICLFH